ncbi:hypothetical protein ACH5RR_012792 [Cinchona calisaya]|uniref:RNase H type-1 domain-containing protein n=1 Tax=Cinchona calisaya TaxID=153742 RepID=A0ABD3A8L0_9GENT
MKVAGEVTIDGKGLLSPVYHCYYFGLAPAIATRLTLLQLMIHYFGQLESTSSSFFQAQYRWSSRGNPRPAAGRRAIRDAGGNLVVTFSSFYVGFNSNLFAELMAVLDDLQLSQGLCIQKGIIELDSTVALDLTTGKNKAPWRLDKVIYLVKQELLHLEYTAVHTFREGNSLADYQTNIGCDDQLVQIVRLDLVLEETNDLDASTSCSSAQKPGKGSGYGFADQIADVMKLEVCTVNLLLEAHGVARHQVGATWFNIDEDVGDVDEDMPPLKDGDVMQRTTTWTKFTDVTLDCRFQTSGIHIFIRY